MPLTQEKRLDANFSNNNDHSYLHKKFKKMATTIAAFPQNLPKVGETRQKESNVTYSTSSGSISNGSIAAAHPELEKIKEDRHHMDPQNERNVQINYSDENSRLSYVNNFVQVTGQTSFPEDFSNKTDNLENDFIRDNYNGSAGGRYVCPYCKLSCAKPSVLLKHIRAHTNERPYPCVPCGFAFKTKSNLYKHRRSRTHALRLQGADIPVTMNDDDLSGGSESDTSIPPTSLSETGSDSSCVRVDNYEFRRFSPSVSPESMNENVIPCMSMNSSSNLIDIKSKTIYKPKFRAAFYQEADDKDKLKKSISPNADFLTEHISKIISDNEAIVDVIETPLQKKYGKIKQIAESKQFLNDAVDMKSESSPLNLTKNNHETDHHLRKRSHSESFSHMDQQKHPLNPEGSIIKDLLLKTKMNGLATLTGELIEGSLYVCPLCQIIFRSADNLETHRMYYCGKGNNVCNPAVSQKDVKAVRPENIFVRSNSINVRLPETQSFSKSGVSTNSPPLRIKPENLVIMKHESNDIVAPLPSPGPLLGNTRLVDTRVPSEYMRKNENTKLKPMASPKRRIDSRSDTYSPRLAENVSPRSGDLYVQPKIRCIDANSATLRAVEEMAQHIRHNSTSLQMFGGEVKILDHLGSTTTMRIEPNKNQLSPILIHHNLSPSKLGSDAEASSIVVRSSLQSGGTIMHNPPTPKETTQPQTPRITISTPGSSSSNLPNIHERTHFQFPPLSAITAFNPLTLPPLSPSSSPNGATTIFHGGKLIPYVPGMPGPNTPGMYQNVQSKINSELNKRSTTPLREDIHASVLQINVQPAKGPMLTKYETQQLRNTRSPHLRLHHNDIDRASPSQDLFNNDAQHYVQQVPLIKVRNTEEPNSFPRTMSPGMVKSVPRQEGALKRSVDGMPRTPILKESMHYTSNKSKNRDKLNSPLLKPIAIKSEKESRSFNFENLITKAEIFNNQILSSSEVQKNTNAQETPITALNERSETLYFQKNVINKLNSEDRKPKFLRPSTLPLKPGTYTPKRHHGITPNANTMPLVSPETPRPAKAYGQLYLNGNAYTYLGLKCSTKVFYCTINRPQPTYVPNQHFLSMYSNWQLLSELTPDPLGLSASSAMSLYDSRHRPQNVARAVIKQDLILTHSSQWNKNLKDHKQAIHANDSKKLEDNKGQPFDNAMTPKKELAGGFESNEEYTYVRGRGRGRYVCSECGIRCKKPSMLKKHIRTHTDVRPYTCIHCAFSFKTKGNLTKHMKSKAHYKKCCELGINPNEGNDQDNGEMATCSGESGDETDSDGDEGNEGETESSDTEACKSRLPEHEAAHCLLSLGSSRPSSSAAPGLITSARPTTYPYTPAGLELATDTLERVHITQSSPVETRVEAENEPMDLSKCEVKTPSTPNITEIPTARESSVLASLASNTAKLPQHQTQWTNGEPMLHTYLTERALLDSKIKQSQLTCNFSKSRKMELETSTPTENAKKEESNKSIKSTNVNMMVPVSSPKIIPPGHIDGKITPSNVGKIASSHEHEIQKPIVVSKEENLITSKNQTNPMNAAQEIKRHIVQNNSNTENAKHVVSEYLKHARINLIKTHDESLLNQSDNVAEDSSNNTGLEENTKHEDINMSDSDSVKLPTLEHEPIARKVVIGVGGVALKVAKGKEFDNSSYPPGRLMEDGRRVCDFCNKTFTKPSQLRLHLNIHYMERPFRCSVCAVSFRTRGHLQKHERSGSHHNKVSMTSTFGAATSVNPRPFRCSDCNIAFRIHGHLAKHLRSKMHVMRLECLFKLPFGTFTEIERAGVSLTDIDTTDCASSLASLQSLARKLHEKDPTKLEYREPGSGTGPPAGRECSEDEDASLCYENMSESEKDSEIKTIENSEVHKNETRVNYSATDI